MMKTKDCPKTRKIMNRLRRCPCCGAEADVSVSTTTGDVMIVCSRNGCRIISSDKLPNAVALWNESRFVEHA